MLLHAQEVILSGGSATITFQTDYPGDSLFLLPVGNTISVGSSGIVGDNSHNWQFTNQGNIMSGTSSTGSGVKLGSAGSGMTKVINSGSIVSYWTAGNGPSGVQFTNGGQVNNLAGGYIEGYDGVHTDIGSLALENAGIIYGNHSGGTSIYSGQGALITNLAGGEIRSENYGISVNGYGLNASILNYGKITTNNRALYLYHGNVYAIYNAPGAEITGGGGQTLRLEGSKGYILNEGTITASNTALSVDNDNGENVYVNAGIITANNGHAVETAATDDGNTIYNLASLTGTAGSIQINGNNTKLVLGQTAYLPQINRYVTGPGSQLNGDVTSAGTNNTILLTDLGSEDAALSGFRLLRMNGNSWTLYHTLILSDSLQVSNGNLTLTDDLSISNAGGGVSVGGGSTLSLADSIEVMLNGSSVFTVENGGTLKVLNTNSISGKKGLSINGNTVVSGAVILDGIFTVSGSLNFKGATLDMHPGTDTIKVVGSVDLSAGNNQINLHEYNAGVYTILTTTGAINGVADDFVSVALNGVPLNPCGYSIEIRSNEIKLTLRGKNISIFSQPSNGTICQGETFTLQVGALGNVTGYEWYRAGNLQPVSYSSSFVTGEAGTYLAKVFGCNDTVYSQPAILTVNRPAAIVSNPQSVTICQGSNYLITFVAEGNGLSYQWYHNNIAIPGATQDTYFIKNASKAIDNGKYKVTVQGICGSKVTSTEANISVADSIPLPILLKVPDTAYVGECTMLHVGFEYGYNDVTNYTWSFGEPNNDISTENDQTVFVTFHTATDSQRVTVVMDHVCCPYVVSKNIRVVECQTGVNDIIASGISVYPNPVQEQLTINNGQLTIKNIVVTDVNGRIIYRQQPNSSNYQLLVANWPKGVYFVKVFTESGLSIHKIIKR